MFTDKIDLIPLYVANKWGGGVKLSVHEGSAKYLADNFHLVEESECLSLRNCV